VLENRNGLSVKVRRSVRAIQCTKSKLRMRATANSFTTKACPFQSRGATRSSRHGDCHLVAGAGMRKVTQVPLPNSLLISALPP
jgi:hypothetical protein